MADIETKINEFPLYIDVDADLGFTKKVKVTSIVISLAIVGLILLGTAWVLFAPLRQP